MNFSKKNLLASQISSDEMRTSDYENDSCDKKLDNFTISREIGSTIDDLMRSDSSDSVDIKSEIDAFSSEQINDVE